MRILVESFSCDPDSGSEGGVGWHYAEEYARQGHDVTVMTSSDARAGIEHHLATPMPSCRFVYVPRRHWPLRLGWTIGSALQYVLWLMEASAEAQSLDSANPFDVLHHASYGSLLGGTFLWRLQRPLVFGPTGGGQTTPTEYLPLFGRYRRSEAFRSFVIRRLWPFVLHARRAVRHAAVVLVSNEETAALARSMGARRVELIQDVAIPDDMMPKVVPDRPSGQGANFLWLGRIMPRKAAELAVLATEAVSPGIDARLTIVGSGANRQMEAGFREWLSRHSATGRVKAVGQVSFAYVPSAYQEADAFIFTSLRDSVGVQLLEAMAFGLPVICLDHHGAHVLVPDAGGIKVEVSSITKTVEQLRRAIESVACNPAARRRMGEANFEEARNFTWSRRASALLNLFDEIRLGPPADRVQRYAMLNAPDSESELDDYTGERYRQFGVRLPIGTRRVLDVGCGVGRGGQQLRLMHPDIILTGLDVVAARLPEAVAHGYSETVCASMTNMPFETGFFDVVLSGEVLEHLDEGDVDSALREIHRVLRPGGVLMLTTPNPNGLRLRLRGGTTLGATHMSAHTPRRIRQRLRMHGFRPTVLLGSGRMTRLIGERIPVIALYGSYLVGAVRV